MLPLKDDTPRYSAPLVNTLLIAINVVVYLFEGTLEPRTQAQFIRMFALNPARLVAGVESSLHPAVVHGVHGAAHGIANGAAHGVSLQMALLPVLTSMFMHASFWYHLLPNMWFLWVFGRSMEDALGHGRYLAFYLVCGVAAAAAQVLSDPATTVPMVGASGAIAGIMGGYFVLYPRARVLMLVPFLFIFFLWLPGVGGAGLLVCDSDPEWRGHGTGAERKRHGRSGLLGSRGRIHGRLRTDQPVPCPGAAVRVPVSLGSMAVCVQSIDKTIPHTSE